MTCPAPWASLMLLPDSFGPECALGTQCAAPDPDSSLRDFWNSDQMVDLRRRHRDGDLPEVCQECEYRAAGGEAYYDQFASRALSSDARRNLECNRAEYRRGALTLSSAPVVLSSDLMYSCNFSCILCSLRKREDRIADEHCEELLYALAPLAAHLHVSGGEPLLDSRFTTFLARCPAPSIPLSITTNGALLGPDVLEALSRFQQVNLHISLDSVDPGLFSRLRPGTMDLHGILARIGMAASYRDRVRAKTGEARWYVAIQFVVMADNLPEIPRIIRKASELGLDEVATCRLDGFYPQHDPVVFLNRIPRQRRDLMLSDIVEAIHMASEVDTDSVARLVTDLRSQLADA